MADDSEFYENDSPAPSERERDEEESERESEILSERSIDSPLFPGTPEEDVESQIDIEESPEQEEGMIVPLREEDQPEFMEPIRIIPRREVSPTDKTLIDSIIDYYKTLKIKDFDPEEIYNMARSERYALASELELVKQPIQEIIDINIPSRRIPLVQEKTHITGYTYDETSIKNYFENKLSEALTNLNPGYPHSVELSKHISNLIWNSDISKDKKLELMARILFQLDSDKAARAAGRVYRLNEDAFRGVQQFLTGFQRDIFIHPGLVLDNNSYVRVDVPPHYIRPFHKFKTPIVKPLKEMHQLPLLTLDVERQDPVRIKNSLTRELTHSLFKLYVKSLPEDREKHLLRELVGCDVLSFRNCSHEMREILPPYVEMAKYINERIFERYKDVDDYIAHMTILLLHLKRENILGFYSTQFQYDLFQNPDIAVYVNYEADMYPALFRSNTLSDKVRAKLWEFTQEEIKDEHKDMKRNIKMWLGLRVPTEIEGRQMSRLYRQDDIENLLGPRYEAQHEIKREPLPGLTPVSAPAPLPVSVTVPEAEEKLYSVTSGGKTYAIKATKNEPELLFGDEEFYLIKYLPEKNTYVILLFTFEDEDDEGWVASILGVSDSTSKKLSQKLKLNIGKTMNLEEIMNTYIPQDFYVIESEDFESSPVEYAQVFSQRLGESYAPVLVTKPSNIKPKVNKFYFDVDEMLGKMGGRVD